MIPDQRSALDKYKKRLKKMQAAQIDSKGNQRVDIEAQVATQELMDIQAEILASSVKTAKVSLTIAVRTSRPAFTAKEYETAETGTRRIAGSKFCISFRRPMVPVPTESRLRSGGC